MGQSNTVTLAVEKEPSSVAIDINTSHIISGESVTITATVTGPYGEPIVGAYVSIHETIDGVDQGVSYKNYTDGNGQVRWTYTPRRMGQYEFYADWAGNETYEGCEEEAGGGSVFEWEDQIL